MGVAMVIRNVETRSSSDGIGLDLKRSARIVGLLYLGFFITGILGSIVVRGQLFVAGDAQGTLSNLTQNELLARFGIVLELGIVLAQAFTALGFYRLFARVDEFAASSLLIFGMVNAVAILGSAALLATALDAAGDASLAVNGGAAATVQLLYVASTHLWGVAALFFGLWLIPMGWLVLRSQWLPRPLGLVLMAGGVCYLASALINYLFPGGDLITQLLTLPATIGEVWIMGYLIITGVRDQGPPRETVDGGPTVHTEAVRGA